MKRIAIKPAGLKKVALLTLAALLVAGAPDALAQKGGGKKKDNAEDAKTKPAPPQPEFTTGIVASYTAENRTLKLNTGGEYKLSAAAGSGAYKQGDKVQIRWLMKGGVRIADQVTENLAIEHPTPAASSTTPASSPTPAAPAAPANPS